MDFKQKFVEIKQYSKAKFEQANAGYSKMEIDNLGNDAIEVVLLSIQNIKKLKQSYPNYFMDTEEFIKNLDKLFELSDKKKEIEERIDNTSNKKGKIALRSMLNSILKKIYKGNK
ncbi:hypothetical protein SPONL_505 [uncultured Candidatus Thioglobus sp.]|nr:hypothetical protein SPONL_505 [uncultured Candidatus Thioglobus sp.]